MKTGLMWDDGAGSLEDRVVRMAQRHYLRYGTVPNVCYVSPDAMDGKVVVQGITVKPHRDVKGTRLWMGVELED